MHKTISAAELTDIMSNAKELATKLVCLTDTQCLYIRGVIDGFALADKTNQD